MDAGFALKYWNMVLMETARKWRNKKPNCRADLRTSQPKSSEISSGRRRTCPGPVGSAVAHSWDRPPGAPSSPRGQPVTSHEAMAACLLWRGLGLGLGDFARPRFFVIQRPNFGTELVPSRGSHEMGDLATPPPPPYKDPNPLGRIRSPCRNSWAGHSFIYCGIRRSKSEQVRIIKI